MHSCQTYDNKVMPHSGQDKHFREGHHHSKREMKTILPQHHFIAPAFVPRNQKGMSQGKLDEIDPNRNQGLPII